jgi:hypothetical protein
MQKAKVGITFAEIPQYGCVSDTIICTANEKGYNQMKMYTEEQRKLDICEAYYLPCRRLEDGICEHTSK